MTKFKKGDRVRLTSGGDDDLPMGSVGTVLEYDSYYPYVSWDGFEGGSSGGGLTDDCSVLPTDEADLELISPPATKARDALNILVAFGFITEAQANAARELARP